MRVTTLVVAMVAAAALLAVTARQLVTAQQPQRMELREIVITLARQPPRTKAQALAGTRVPCVYDWYDDYDAPDCDDEERPMTAAEAAAVIENDPLWTLDVDNSDDDMPAPHADDDA